MDVAKPKLAGQHLRDHILARIALLNQDRTQLALGRFLLQRQRRLQLLRSDEARVHQDLAHTARRAGLVKRLDRDLARPSPRHGFDALGIALLLRGGRRRLRLAQFGHFALQLLDFGFQRVQAPERVPHRFPAILQEPLENGEIRVNVQLQRFGRGLRMTLKTAPRIGKLFGKAPLRLVDFRRP